MPIYWSYKRLPELSALSDAERKDLWKQAVGQAYERWQTWLVSPILIGPTMFVGQWLGSAFGHDRIGLLIGLVLATPIAAQIMFRIARSHLKRIIARTDEG